MEETGPRPRGPVTRRACRASIEPKGDGYVVRLAFGRAGRGPGQCARTARPVPYERARAFLDRLTSAPARGDHGGREATWQTR